MTTEFKKLSEINDFHEFEFFSRYMEAWAVPELLAGLLHPNNQILQQHTAVQLRQELTRLIDIGEILVYDQYTHLQVNDANISFQIAADGLTKFAAKCGLTMHFKQMQIEPLAEQSAPTPKGEAVTATTLNDDAAHDEKLAALFNSVPVEALAKTFPTDQNEAESLAQWKKWAEKAKRLGLINARTSTGMFNLYKAGLWFVRKGAQGWDEAKLRRVLANNLPARSLDDKHLLTGDID